MKRLISILLTLLLCVGLVPMTAQGAEEEIDLHSWMAQIPDEASLGQINLPGSHDSATFNVGYSKEIIPAMGKLIRHYVPMPWLIPAAIVAVPVLVLVLLPMSFRLPSLLRNVVFGLGQCVDMDIAGQLNTGLRGLDLRLAYNWREYSEDGFQAEGMDVYEIGQHLRMMHGSVADVDAFLPFVKHDVPLAAALNWDDTPLTMADVLRDCQNFLEANPSETVILFYKNEGTLDEYIKDSPYNKAIDAFMNYVESVDDNLIALPAFAELPTMGEARGNIYFIFSDDCYLLENEWDVSAKEKIALLRGYFGESDSIAQEYGKVCRLSNIQRDTAPRVLYTSTYYNMGPNVRNIFLGGAPIKGSPKALAGPINDFVAQYNFQKGRYYGWIMMNFPTERETLHIIHSNRFIGE